MIDHRSIFQHKYTTVPYCSVPSPSTLTWHVTSCHCFCYCSCTLFYHLPRFSIYLIHILIFLFQSTSSADLLRICFPSHLPYLSFTSFSNLTFLSTSFTDLLKILIRIKTQSTSFYHLPNISFYSPDILFSLYYVPSHGRSYLVTPQKTHEIGSTVYVSVFRQHHGPISRYWKGSTHTS